MSAVASRFRPWLDDMGAAGPGSWPDWDLAEEESAQIAAAMTEAAALAVERLRNLYGEQADTFGAATPPG